MDKNIDFKALAAELAALEKQGKGHGDDLLIARVLHNMSPTRWKAFCKAYPASKWGALPVSSLPVSQMADGEKDSEFLLGDELKHAVMAEKFTEQVGRELVRMGRVGGELSLLGCDIVGDKIENSCKTQLNEILFNLIRDNLETCDSLATDAKGHPLILLPGTGPVRSRHLGEQIQKKYAKAARTQVPDSLVVIGLISIAQGEKRTAEELVKRVAEALQKSYTEPSHFYQIGPEALNERSTLVHSDEKRFLFFGGAN
ncbi:MAG: hypothetical protein IJS50_05120 [Desulfovibrio sp.]|nr:hypothetical protein [Desulfovibrio sp.]